MSTKIAPKADNTHRTGEGGNVSVKGEKHGQKKASHVGAGQRFSTGTGGASQPGRQNKDGNTSVTGESHGQKKSERVTADQRF